MNLVDSSGWLEYFADGPNSIFFATPLKKVDELVVPTISIYEVFKSVFRQRGESAGLQAVAVMKQGQVYDLTTNISMMAAKLSLTHNIPMAGSIILTTGRLHQATVWTQDADFKGLEGIEYIKKKK
ncbi:MAG: type II toxin-antitoxin system VapC family toxin [Candidatus Scalindua rubra]|uniref:PIN domain protein n=1 Tax=Candidatus Scalindua brodae TaxID=237368 RepID=A0A0B0EIV3_9BACT|nr:MAG: PIN domain protein [Candidatus Scalindua brodae]MBZ0110138.1 type II toxin-antitoxin system VapC family toxin [Candidatus Scalindua rubra]